LMHTPVPFARPCRCRPGVTGDGALMRRVFHKRFIPTTSQYRNGSRPGRRCGRSRRTGRRREMFLLTSTRSGHPCELATILGSGSSISSEVDDRGRGHGRHQVVDSSPMAEPQNCSSVAATRRPWPEHMMWSLSS
jgi:hypothetical protein